MSKKNNEFLILGSIIVGLFVLLGVTNIDFSVEEAQAQEQYPTVTRNATSEKTMFSETHGSIKLGLPAHIKDNQGDYVSSLLYEDPAGIELESGSVSYYFDKTFCAMSLFDYGRINQTSVPIIKGDMWVVKVAPNGTDNWTDIPQNDLPCEVTTTIDGSDMIEINSTKSDVNGTITELYHYDKYEGMKHDMSFTNNNTAWNDHKFSFSNILLDVPNSFMINMAGETVQDYFPQNGIVNYTGTPEDPNIYYEIDIGNNPAGDVLRSTSAIPVNANDVIINATLLFLTNSTGHEAGVGRAILYDQDLNHIGTSEEVTILDNTVVCEISGNCSTDVKTRFNFSPPIQVNQTNATSVFVGVFFNDAGGKIVPIVEQNGGTVEKDTSNTYPTAPDPFVNNVTHNSTNTFWTQLTVNGVQPDVINEWYSQWQPIDQNYRFGGQATVLETDVDGETIQYNATQFFLDDGTQINTGFLLLQKTSQPDPTISPIEYHFIEGIEDLWAVKFVSNPDFTLDVYVDYANVTETLPVGQTINLDPILNFGSLSDRTFGLSFGSTCGVSAGSSSPAGGSGVVAESKSGASASCSGTYVRYDISAIDDDAVPTRITFQANVTSGSCSGTFCTSVGVGRIFQIFGEDLNGFSDADFTLAMRPVGGAFDVIDPTLITSIGNTPISPTFPFLRIATLSSPTDKAIVDFEAQLESGRNYVQYAICPSVFSGGCSGNGAVASRSNSMVWERFGASFYEVEFEFFDVPTAPQQVTAAYSPSPDTCTVDFEPPLDDGGRPVDGYQIERSTTSPTSGFSILVADTGTPIPTEFADTTITGGVSHFYRVAAINLEGVGAVSASSNSCGVPDDPSAPFGVIAQNVALNTVAVNWNAPAFDGNSPITGYQVNRTQGSIQLPDITQTIAPIFLKEHDPAGVDPTLTVSNIGDIVTRAAHPFTGNAGSVYYVLVPNIPSTFIDGSAGSIQWAGGCAGGTGTMTARVEIWDGNYDGSDSSVFPAGSPIVLKGNGILDTLTSNSDACSDAGQFGLTTNAWSDTDTSSATFDDVTIAVVFTDGTTWTGNAVYEVTQIRMFDFAEYDNGSSALCGGGITSIVSGTPRDEFECRVDPLTIFADQDGFKILVADTGTPLLEHIDDTVETNTFYGYRVKATNAIGESPNSNVGTVTTVGLPPPPVLDSVTPTSATTITVDWTEPDVGGTIIQGYQIDRKIGVGGIYSTIDPFTGNDDTDFFDSLLLAGTEYCYRLKTITNIGTSTTFSNEVCGTTFDVPDRVENLTSTAIDGSSINVSWDTPLDDGGSTITGYKIERLKQGDSFITLFAERQPESNRILNDTSLEIGTTYTYRISAISSFGQGETRTTTDTTDSTPQAPPNIACSPAGTTSINLSWDTPTTFSPPTGYQIDRKLVGGSFSTIESDTGTTETTFLDSGLDVEETYVYRVLGKTAEGDTDFSDEITCSPLRAPDTPPENVQGDFSEVVPHQTVIGWDIPDTFGVPISEFRIERDDGAGYVELETVSGSVFAFIDQALDNDVDQRYRIITVGTEGESVPSIAIPFDTNQRSHWHYEGTVDDTGAEKNMGTVIGNVNFDNVTSHIGDGFFFDSVTRIEVDPTQEVDYDFDQDEDFGISTYYKSAGGNVTLTTDENWQLREQQMTTLDTIDGAFTISPPLDADLTIAPDRGFVHVFKVFPKSDIIGKVLNITWAGTFTGAGATNQLHILDGAYDRTNSTHFPSNDLQDGFCIGQACELGVGVLHSVVRAMPPAYSGTDQITMTLAGSTESDVTVAMSTRIGSAGVTTTMDITEVDIAGLANWKFDSNAGVTMAVTGTSGDYGIANATFVSTSSADSLAIVTKADNLDSVGYKFYTDVSGFPSVKLTNTTTSNEIHVRASTDVNDDTLHFIGFGYNGNGTASGISMNIDGTPVTPVIIVDNLSGGILNNEPLTIGGTANGGNQLVNSTLDETRFFGSGTLDDDQLDEIANDKLDTVAPINATIGLVGSTFANISGEVPTIILISGFPSPTVSAVDLKNFTTTTVNSVTPSGVIDPITGVLQVPTLFNFMGSLSNYTADTTLTNIAEVFPILSNFDLQSPIFTFTGDFFFQQARNPTFDILSFNYTQTAVPFDLTCNFKSTLFGNGTTISFTDVFFVQTLVDVDPLQDVVVACIDPNTPPVDPTAPSFGGSNALLSFVSFGDTTGIGNFLNFTENFGDFFGAALPFLFIIILAAAFTGRSAPTGIIIIGIALGIMWAMGILTLDPIMWGVIVVLIILGLLGGKKFL